MVSFLWRFSALIAAFSGILSVPTAVAQQTCTIETFAGLSDTTPGDGGPATQEALYSPFDGDIAADGTVYFTDAVARAVRRIRPDGVIETLLDRTIDPDLDFTTQMALAPDGSVVFHDGPGLGRILLNGTVEPVSGNGAFGSPEEGALAVESPWMGRGFAFASDGTLYFAESQRHRVRRISPDGRVFTVAGAAEPDRFGRVRGGFSGDGGPAIDGELNTPQDVAVAPDGSVYVTDRNNRRIRRIRPDGIIETAAGGGGNDALDLSGVPAREAALTRPDRIEADAQGMVYFTHGGSSIYRIDPDGILRAVAEVSSIAPFFVGPGGTVVYRDRNLQLVRVSPEGESEALTGIDGVPASTPKDGPATETWLRTYDLAFGPSGDLYAAAGTWIFAISPDGTLRRAAGGGERSFETQEGEPAREVNLFDVQYLAIDGDERVYFSEGSGAKRIRSIEPNGTIGFIAGAVFGCRFDEVCGIGGPAREAEIPDPEDLYVGADGSLYFVSGYNSAQSFGRSDQILRITPDGVLAETAFPPIDPSRLSGRYRLYFANRSPASQPVYWLQTFFGPETRPPFFELQADGSSRPLAAAQGFANPYEDAVVAEDGSIYFTTDDQRIRKALPDGRVVTIAGAAQKRGYAGDGGPARLARFREPRGLAIGPDGALYISDFGNARIRRILDVASCEDGPSPEIALHGVVHAADFLNFDSGVELGAAPGMIVSIFGRNLGPEQPRTAQVEDGRLVTELAGVRVLVDGVAAPLVFVSAGQINAIIPYATEVRHQIDRDGFHVNLGYSSIEVEVNGTRSDTFAIHTRATRPGIFLVEPGVSERGAVLNQDGTLNSPDNPAPAGSVLVLFATGEGQTDPAGVDGLLAVDALPVPIAEVSVRVGDVESTVLYAGAAPGFTAGLFQANARMGIGTPSGEQRLTLRVGQGERSVPVWIAP